MSEPSGWGEHQRVPVGDLVLDVRCAGPQDGPVVLLLHGFPQTSTVWAGVVPALVAAGLRVVAPDQRGYSPGARPPAADAYRTDTLAADATAVLAAVGAPSAHVVGHDWGAVVAWHLAARRPELVRTLTVVSVPHPAAYAGARAHDEDQARRSAYVDLFRDVDRAVPALLADGGRRLRAMFDDAADPAAAAAHAAALGSPDALAAALRWYGAMDETFGDLPDVDLPTTFVWSTADRAVGRAAALACGAHVVAPYRFVELEGVSHWVPDDAPGPLVDAVLARVGDVGR